jgi:pimeloyl-ACP methyl ester carboxylesterase
MPFERMTLALPGAGRMDLLEFGAPAGAPTLYLHGTPSSASEAHWLHQPALEASVRIVAVDRPGYLYSTPVSSTETAARAYLDVIDHLTIGRFAVVGFSGGANSALAVAAAAPDRVIAAHVGGALGSLSSLRGGELGRARRTMFRAMSYSPRFAKAMAALQRRSLRKNLGDKLNTPTYAIFELLSGAAGGSQLPALENYVRRSSPRDLAAFVEGYFAGAKGTDGLLADLATFTSPIDFDRITVPIELWHGTADQAIPIEAARVLAGRLPNATLHELADEGHFVLLSHGSEICTAIARALRWEQLDD